MRGRGNAQAILTEKPLVAGVVAVADASFRSRFTSDLTHIVFVARVPGNTTAVWFAGTFGMPWRTVNGHT